MALDCLISIDWANFATVQVIEANAVLSNGRKNPVCTVSISGSVPQAFNRPETGLSRPHALGIMTACAIVAGWKSIALKLTA